MFYSSIIVFCIFSIASSAIVVLIKFDGVGKNACASGEFYSFKGLILIMFEFSVPSKTLIFICSSFSTVFGFINKSRFAKCSLLAYQLRKLFSSSFANVTRLCAKTMLPH
jgi:hypothetical protein